MSDPSGEQLDLFPDAPGLPALPRARAAEPRRQRSAAAASNDLDLVTEVLAIAGGAGYLIEDTSAGTRIWRASGALEARRELPLLERASRDEAAMVAQLVERSWLHRAGRRQTRAAEQRGKSSGRRRFDVAAHPLTVPATTRHTLARWSALAAIPVQRTAHNDP